MTYLDRKEMGSCSGPSDSPCHHLCLVRMSGYCCAASATRNRAPWRPHLGVDGNATLHCLYLVSWQFRFWRLYFRSRVLRLRRPPGWIG